MRSQVFRKSYPPMPVRYCCANMVETKVRVVSQYVRGERSGKDASAVLGITERSVRTLASKYRIEGEAGLVPKKP